jgi:hypothetical protein
MVFLATGNVSFGMNKRNEAGEIVESTPAAFEHKDGGPCVIVGQLDPETMQQVGPATPYGDWQASKYLGQALEVLRPLRSLDVPDIKAIWKMAKERGGVDLCEYCQNWPICRDCVVNEWKGEYGDA